MTKIKDIDSALSIFEEATANQAEATEQGDYRKANKCYKSITEAVDYLKEHNSCHLAFSLS